MPTLQTADERMLELMYLLISLKEIRFQTEFARTVGVHKSYITKVRYGNVFTSTHIERACKEYSVNANWIMGIETDVFRRMRNTRKINNIIMELRRSELSTKRNPSRNQKKNSLTTT